MTMTIGTPSQLLLAMRAGKTLAEMESSQAAHTPGPWETAPNSGPKGEISITANSAPCLIARMCNGGRNAWPEETRANADFIVRAVNCHDEMLAALRLVEDYLCRHQVSIPISIRHQARAAISAAEGSDNAH